MGTEYQWVFDRAETISVDTRPNILQTISRNGTIRSTNLGGNVNRFEVKVPDGIPYNEIKNRLIDIQTVDRHTATNVTVTLDGIEYGTFTVMCSNLPKWTLFGSKNINQVSWDGTFNFVEII
jgi:hypothetical protein